MRATLSLAVVALVSCRAPDPPPPATGSDDGGAEVSDAEADAATDALPDPSALENLLEPIRAAHGLPALAAAAFSSEKLLGVGAVGVRKLGDATPVTRADRWHLGSDTKAMTATLLATYVGEASLAWTTTMAEAFPSDAASFDAAYRSVSIETLLQHRGGAPAAVPPDIWSEMWKAGDPAVQRRAAVIAMLGRAPETPPGTKFVYSNAGYMMAGAALEEKTKASWESLMRTRLFGPLSMASCGFGAPASVGKIDQPWGHALKSGTPSPVAPGPGADNPPSLGPAGTVHCDLVDWGKFLQLHLRGARGAKTPLLEPSAFTRMHTPPSGGEYALGWIVASRTWAGGTVLTHAGSNTMFYAVAWIAPKRDLAFVAVTNLGGEGAAAGVDAAIGRLVSRYASFK